MLALCHKGRSKYFSYSTYSFCADVVKPLQIHWRRQSWTTFRKLSYLSAYFHLPLPPLPLQLLLTTATINTPSSRLHQPSRTHHHASDRLWEAHLPPSGMTPTFRWPTHHPNPNSHIHALYWVREELEVPIQNRRG